MLRGATRIALGALVTGLLLVPGTARACACGAAYAPEGHTVEAGEETAFLSWEVEGERERLEMLLGITAQTPEVAVVIPTPTVPEVTQGDPDRFDELVRLTTPPPEDDGWSLFGEEDGAGAPGSAPSVVSETVLEDVVATVIEGGSASGVEAWLRANGYATKPQLEPVIASYLEEGWRFTAVKMRADKPFDGYADPLVLTFDTPRLVYPMRLSSAADTAEVTVFTLARSFLEPEASWAGSGPPAAAVELVEDGVSDDVIEDLVEEGSTRLTKWTFVVEDPAAITTDLTFDRAGLGESFVPAATQDLRDAEAALPPWVAVLSGVIGLGLGAGVVLLVLLVLRLRRGRLGSAVG